MSWEREDKEEAITSLRNEPLLQPNVQRYLGISDGMITGWLVEALKSDVSVETPDYYHPDRPVQFKVNKYSQLARNFGGVEDMCNFIEQNFGNAGIILGVMPQVAKAIKIALLSERLESMSNDGRANRKARAKAFEALNAILELPSKS